MNHRTDPRRQNRLFVRQSKGCNLVHVEEAAKVLSVSPGDILQWIFTFDEHSCAMLRTKDGLFVEVEGITRIATRRCENRQVQAWKREISPYRRVLTESEKKRVAASQKYTCAQCERQLTHLYEVDHVEEQSIRKNHHFSNLQALCPGCHKRKTDGDRMYGDPLFEPATGDVDEANNVFSKYFYTQTTY